MSTYTLAQAKDQLARLVDEALAGEPVTITRGGKPVVSLQPSVTAPGPAPMTPEDVAKMARRRAGRPRLSRDSVTLVRDLRDEER